MPEKYIWVFPSLPQAWMWRDVAAYLAARLGMRPLFVAFTEQDKPFWQNQFDEPLDGAISVHCDYLGFVARGADPTAEPSEFLARARAFEAENRLTLMRDMVLGCRHLGRGFLFGGKGHPKSFVSERSSHMAAIQACLKVVDYFEDLARTYPPGLMLTGGGGGGVYMRPACLLARRRGVPFRSLVHGRFGDLYYWADSEYEESAAFRQLLARSPLPDDAEAAAVAERAQPTGLSVAGFAQMRRELRWPRIALRIAETYARYAYGRLRRYRLTTAGYKPGETARLLIRRRRHWERLDRVAPTRLKYLPPYMKVVYFPLQTEPEHSINVLSPEHSNQLATAGELALGLPANALLAVKEHPYQLGRRTAGFYETLAEIPNVVMLHPDEPSLEIIRRADLVAVITGSAGYEAAVLGKPVIHFGRHGQILDLPHVHGMTGFQGLERIAEILEDDKRETAAERRRAGARYFLALEAFALDMGRFGGPGRDRRASREEAREIGNALLKTLPSENGRLCA